MPSRSCLHRRLSWTIGSRTHRRWSSEHVLVDMDDKRQYRFFHESFFDYAYARRFASADRRVVDFLRSTEQHLFRRSQVRQILDYRREHDFGRYLADVRDIFESEEVRFHIKRMVASGFSRIERPRVPEWQLLEPHLLCGPLSRYVLGALDSHSGWFDLLNSNAVFRRWLASEDTVRIDTSIGYLQSPIFKTCGPRRLLHSFVRMRTWMPRGVLGS